MRCRGIKVSVSMRGRFEISMESMTKIAVCSALKRGGKVNAIVRETRILFLHPFLLPRKMESSEIRRSSRIPIIPTAEHKFIKTCSK